LSDDRDNQLFVTVAAMKLLLGRLYESALARQIVQVMFLLQTARRRRIF
jgi:hypothetical protein